MTENDDKAKGVVKMMYSFCTDEPDLLVPDFLYDKEFLRSLRNFLFISQLSLKLRWEDFLTNFLHRMLSYENYASYVLYACRLEHDLHSHMFEVFLAVSGTAIFICLETANRTEVDMHHLTFNIIMVYYEKYLKKDFNLYGGFSDFKEYVNLHEYAAWGMPYKYVKFRDLNNSVTIIAKELVKNLQKDCKNQQVPRNKKIDETNMKSANRLAKKALSTTKVPLPTLPLASDLKEKLYEYEQAKGTKSIEKKRTTETIHKQPDMDEKRGLSISNSGSKPKAELEEMNDAECAKIVDAVVRCNNFRKSSNAGFNNPVQTDVNEILNHLKDGIKSFIEILDQQFKE